MPCASVTANSPIAALNRTCTGLVASADFMRGNAARDFGNRCHACCVFRVHPMGLPSVEARWSTPFWYETKANVLALAKPFAASAPQGEHMALPGIMHCSGIFLCACVVCRQVWHKTTLAQCPILLARIRAKRQRLSPGSCLKQPGARLVAKTFIDLALPLAYPEHVEQNVCSGVLWAGGKHNLAMGNEYRRILGV